MSQRDNDGSLFDRVVELTGLSPMLGPGIVRRALQEAGVDPSRPDPVQYARGVARLRFRLSAYLEPEEAFRRCALIFDMLRSEAPPDSDFPPPPVEDVEVDEEAARIRRGIELMQEVRTRLSTIPPPRKSPSSRAPEPKDE